MIRIEQVVDNSAADLAGIEAGDRLLAMDDRTLDDIVDYYLALSEKDQVELLVRRGEDDPFRVMLDLGEEEDPGLIPAHPEPAHCGNNCLFCFVHQLPRGLRRTLYVKDEDYRFSWLYGSYITLGNTREDELQRIIRDQLSPLYISVHATDERVRCQLLGKDVLPILPQLERLTTAGIELHTQVVLCPGINDGEILQRTLDDLAGFRPMIRTLAIVPVGLTTHRRNLPEIAPVTPALATEVLDLVAENQLKYLADQGSRFVFAADELYLRADREFPLIEEYEELSQLENGVGMLPLFRQEAEEVLLEAIALDLRRVSLVTGKSFAPELETFATRLGTRIGVDLNVVAVDNRLFGPSVTVTGLLSGADIRAAFDGVDPGDAILLPDVLFNDAEVRMLDDMRLEDLQRHFNVPLMRVGNDPWGILDGLERLDCREIEILEG